MNSTQWFNSTSSIVSQRDSLRRGNTIVLVAGILVLLVIIATAYVTRTGGERITAKVTSDAGLIDDTHRVISQMLADEIGLSLFPRPLVAGNAASATAPAISPADPGLWTTAAPHLYPPPFDSDRYEPDANYPWNFPPYNVVAWTNWPDDGPGVNTVTATKLPAGPGNPSGGTFSVLLNCEYNPLGGPGFGDCRWLRDLEPMRWYTKEFPADELFPLANGPDAYSHWRHLSNPSRPDNAWRAVSDISDLFDLSGDQFNDGLLVTDLRIPIEQWLTAIPANTDFATTGGNNLAGTTRFTNAGAYMTNWRTWFGLATQNPGLVGYAHLLSPPAGTVKQTPGNRYRLSDLDANNKVHDWYINGVPQDRPESEFIPGTARWNVSRVLADADGDGYTDSFWWLAPTSVENGIRQIVAVSIVDNQGMLNANVATNFVRNGTEETKGTTPADIALVGAKHDLGTQFSHLLASNWNVGFYDNPNHDFWTFAAGAQVGALEYVKRFDYNVGRWEQHLKEVGLPWGAATDNTVSAAERLKYWQSSASSPLSVDPTTSYTPYSLADEIELRMYAGSNYPFIYTRFEASVQDEDAVLDHRFLRANRNFSEASEFTAGTTGLDGQLSNRQSLVDPRHRITLYNSVRNDIMPPWLWSNPKEAETKIDLRDPDFNIVAQDLNGNGTPNDADDRILYLRNAVFRALTDPDDPQVTNRYSYYGLGDGTGDNGVHETRSLAAGYVANLLEWRDEDSQALLADTVPVAGIPGGTTPPSRYMGMEPQPFIVEAFIGHIHKAIIVNPGFYDANGNGIQDGQEPEYLNAGQFVVTDDDDRRSTVVAVQIANPFDKPINLFNEKYQLTVMNQTIRLTGTLAPGTPENPTTAIFFAIRDNMVADAQPNAQLKMKWCDYLDIPDLQTGITVADCEQPQNVLIQQVRQGTQLGINPTPMTGLPPGGPIGGGPGGGPPPPPPPPPVGGGPGGGGPPPVAEPWAVSSREPYDTGDILNALVLSRLETDTGPVIVVDRMDRPGSPIFGEAVRRMGEEGNKPPVVDDPPGDYQIDTPLLPYGFEEGADNFNLGQADLANPTQGFTQWVQWVRATRAWGADVNTNGKYDQAERNPRYVFGDYAVIESGDSASETQTTNWVKSGNKYQYLKDSDDDISNQTGPRWFERKYINMAGLEVKHQPTFFNMKGARAVGATPYIPDYPDKGWYSQTSETIGTPLAPRLNFPFQTLHKNGDFEQVGEIYNVMLFGHRLRAPNVNGAVTYQGTEITFSEAISDEPNLVPYVGQDARVNRFRMLPSDTEPPINSNPQTTDVTVGYVLGVGNQSNPKDPRHSIPNMPAAARLIDLFVCDGPGLTGTAGVDDLRLAGGFQRRGTPGMINIGTASIEVMRALPNWYRLVHKTGGPNDDPNANMGNEFHTPADQPLVTTNTVPDAVLPRVMLPEAVEAYRERFNGEAPTAANPTGIPGGPNYENRTKLYPGQPAVQQIRGERGFASIGELFALKVSGSAKIDRQTVPGDPGQPIDEIFQQFWRIDMGTTVGSTNSLNTPFKDTFGEQVSMRLSTDTVGEYDMLNPNTPRDDRVAGDAEEANLLFNGVSNLITTRSDTFTVYFRVRSFRQNTSKTPAIWDATDPDYIIDDSRYVMLVDRTNVNTPSDKPRILYFEKLPN